MSGELELMKAVNGLEGGKPHELRRQFYSIFALISVREKHKMTNLIIHRRFDAIDESFLAFCVIQKKFVSKRGWNFSVIYDLIIDLVLFRREGFPGKGQMKNVKRKFVLFSSVTIIRWNKHES